MNIKLRIILSALLFSTISLPSYSALDFVESSRLSKGKWIKIAIPEAGMYEVSYDKLRELGFSSPESVGLFGTGGAELPLNFTDGVGNPLLKDDLPSIPVIHTDDRIIFYAQGPENIKWQKTTDLPSTNGRFTNSGLNFYSSFSYYFLSDQFSSEMTIQSLSTQNITKQTTTGVSYIYHEQDLAPGPNTSGKELWGENFIGYPDYSKKFQTALPGFISQHTGVMECNFMAGSYSPSTLEFGISGANNVSSTIPALNSGAAYNMNTKKYGPCEIPSSKPEVLISLSPSGSLNVARLDYFILSYLRSFEFSPDEKDFTVQVTTSGKSIIPVKSESSVKMIDITNASKPELLAIKGDGFVVTGEKRLQVFRYNTSLRSPAKFEHIANQNLHALPQSNNPEMIIVTTDEIRPVAEKISALHKELGQNVVTVTCREIYNEFSSGRPDPMAIRLFAKTFLDKEESKLKAVFLCGPGMSYLKTTGKENEFIIIPQSENGAYASDTYSCIDLYGMTDSFFSNKLSLRPIRLGVGILPIRSISEGEAYLKKLRQFHADETLHLWSDNAMFLCDDNNKGMHMNSTEKLAYAMTEYSSAKMNIIKNYLGETGPKEILNYWTSSADDGLLYSLYMGHGQLSTIGSYTFYSPSKAWKFSGDHLGFMVFAGCMTSNYETLRPGVAESLVTGTRGGLVGCIGTTRSVWAQDNHNLVNRFHQELFSSDNGVPPTLGEALMKAKSTENNTNKFNFHLICDPLLRLPIPTLNIKTSTINGIEPGKDFYLNGDITSADGKKFNTFNGSVAVKWFAPAITQTAKCLYSHDQIDYKIDYDQNIVEIQTGEISNGSFDLHLYCPEQLKDYAGKPLTISITAFDPTQRLSANYRCKVTINSHSSGIVSNDTEAPVIEMMEIESEDIMNLMQGVHFKAIVTDNHGIRYHCTSPTSTCTLKLDGRPYNPGNNLSITDGGKKLLLDVPLPDLIPGAHSIELGAMDYAGNSVSRHIEFFINDSEAHAGLSIRPGVHRENVEFEIPTELSANLNSPELIIINNRGEIIFRKPIASTLQWDMTSDSGDRVESGLYKAYLSGMNSAGRSVYTRPVPVPVLDVK